MSDLIPTVTTRTIPADVPFDASTAIGEASRICEREADRLDALNLDYDEWTAAAYDDLDGISTKLDQDIEETWFEGEYVSRDYGSYYEPAHVELNYWGEQHVAGLEAEAIKAARVVIEALPQCEALDAALAVLGRVA